MSVATLGGAVLGWFLSGSEGLRCVLVASAVCVATGVIVVLIQERLKSPQWVLANVLVGFLFRMGVPLAFCLVVYWRGGPLVEAGFVFYLLFFYMVSLAVETVLSLPPSSALWPGRK